MSALATHVSREPLPADCGRGFGRAQRDAVHSTVRVYGRIFSEDLGLDEAAVRERGRQVEAVVRAYRPALCDELEGVAAGAGVCAELLYAINARTELLSGGQLSGAIGGECSTLAVVEPDGSRALLGQTWDFHPALRASRVLWTRCLPDGAWLTTFTEAGILAKIGASSHGVALGMNFLSTDRDGGTAGVPVHVLVRVVLEEARTLEDARALIEQAPADGSACLTVAGPSRTGGVDVVAFERWPGGVGAEAPAPATHTLVHTNHFVTPIAARDTMRAGRAGDSTTLRYKHLRAAVDHGAPCDARAVGELLSAESPNAQESIFQREDASRPWLERCTTLATLVIELPPGAIWVRVEDDPALPLERADRSPSLGSKLIP